MINIKGEHNMANKQLRETLSLDRVAFKERALNELKELNPCDKARAITECLDHFIKGRAWVDAINLDDITIMVTQSKGDDNTLVESVINQVSPRAMAKKLNEGSNASDWDLMRKAKNFTQEEVLKALKGVVSTKTYNDIKNDYKIAKLRHLTNSEQEKVAKKLEKKDIKESLEKPLNESMSLLEGTSNFGSLDNFPLLVYIPYDEFYDSLEYVDGYPKMEDYDNEDDYYEAQEKFVDEYYDKHYKGVALLTDEDVANLESDIEDFNRQTKDIAYDLDNYDLEDIQLKLEPGYYEGVQVDCEYEKSFNYLDEKVKEEQLARFKKFFDDIKNKYGLTSLSVAYRFSNGETGYTVNEALKEDYTWHSIDLGTEKAEKLKQFLRDNEIYFEPSSNGDLVHFEIKIDSDDVKDMINKYLNEGLTEGAKEPQEVNATLYYEEDGEPLLVFDTIATNDGKIDVFSFRDGHTAADQGYIDTLKKAKVDDRARALIKHYEDNYPVKVNLQEDLEERWVVFKFEEGNPYVAKTDEEKERILKKYEGRVEQLDDMAYFVKNKTVAEPVKEGYYDEMDEQYADILDKDVDVYNVKQYVLDGTDNKYRTHYTDKYAIIVAPNGKGCVLDYEAVGQDFDNIDDKISFGIEENKDNEWVDEQGNKHTTINVMATHRINTTPKDVMEKAPKETMKFRDFFRKYKYNDRCSANFRGMVKYLKDNGYTGK